MSLLCLLAQQDLKQRTIKSYLSRLRFMQIREGLGNPGLPNMPQLEYVLNGIKRKQAHADRILGRLGLE